MLDFSADIARSRARWEASHDPSAPERLDELAAMDTAAEAITNLTERHAAETRRLAATADPVRRIELERIAEVCGPGPARPPR